MESASQFVRHIISSRRLPSDGQPFLEEFASIDKKRLELQEGSLWDYKKDFPFSRSDDYFGGIVRLICAFHNTYGGLIIFGVDDKSRQITGNPIKINIEAFNSVLRDRLTSAIECSVCSYDLADNQHLDLLLVPKRAIGAAPVRFSVAIGRYPEGRVYVRQNHEVLAARSSDLPFLYGPRHEAQIDQDRGDPPDLISSLPPSPSTVKEFIGRSEVMDCLWHWLVYNDEPRTFLFGKGGSGKSTIAFEFARTVAHNAPHFTASNGHKIDTVIFLSAKKHALDTVSGHVVPFVGSDFGTADELFRQILALSEWRTFEDVERIPLEALRVELSQLMDTITPLIVIDDIDTLTTLGLDPGMDGLYRSAIRAKKGAKILYTLRNAPTQSLAQAIEVPGLQDGEYREFISACCNQFRQPEPSDQIIDGPLSERSERRPLVIEAVIGLRRTAGSYETALELLQQRAGDEIRSYLFDREYNALATDNRARYLLAALSVSPKPMGFADLEAVTRFNPQQLNDAVGEVSEMFLTLHEEAGETRYGLGQSTQDYIANRREQLDLMPQMRERVQNYTSAFLRQPRELTRLIEETKKALFYYKDPAQALATLERRRDNPKITEHPVYQSWIGTVAAKHDPPLLDKARDAFEFSSSLTRLDPGAAREWYFLERTSGTGIEKAIRICDKILDEKNYSLNIRTEFCSKKGFVLQIKAQNLSATDPDGAVKCFAQSLDCNILAYNGALNLPSMDVEKLSDWAGGCATRFADMCIRNERVKFFFDTLDEYAKKKLACDPLGKAIVEVSHWAGRRTNIPDIDRAIGFLNHFHRSFTRSQRPLVFLDADLRKEIVLTLSRTVSNSKQMREQLKIGKPHL